MANSPRTYDATVNASVNAQTALANGGSIRIFSGAQPAVDVALTGTLLVTLAMNATAFGTSAASGTGALATANSITSGTAVATNTAGYFAILKSDGTTVVGTGSVGTSGADLNLSTLSINTGDTVACSSFTWTQPQQ